MRHGFNEILPVDSLKYAAPTSIVHRLIQNNPGWYVDEGVEGGGWSWWVGLHVTGQPRMRRGEGNQRNRLLDAHKGIVVHSTSAGPLNCGSSGVLGRMLAGIIRRWCIVPLCVCVWEGGGGTGEAEQRAAHVAVLAALGQPELQRAHDSHTKQTLECCRVLRELQQPVHVIGS